MPYLENGAAFLALSVPHIDHLQEITTQVAADPLLSWIVDKLQADPISHPSYSLVQGHLLYKNRLVLPAHSSFIH